MTRFYADRKALRPDVPLIRVRGGDAYGDTALVLVSGANFFDEMAAFAGELGEKGLAAACIDDTRYPHHWNSGWMIRALAEAG
jgi:hypothetical protein